jgi:hypothetical protein
VTTRFLMGVAEAGVFPGCESILQSILVLGKLADMGEKRLLLDWHVVQGLGGAKAFLVLLQRREHGRRLWRSACQCYRQNGWHSRLLCVTLDLHP